MTAEGGSVSSGCKFVISLGTETGGGVTSTRAPGAGRCGGSFCNALGDGAITLASKLGTACALSCWTSAGGGMADIGISARLDVDSNPLAGGGPGTLLYASRLATAESECGRLSFGASTTCSFREGPRATR